MNGKHPFSLRPLAMALALLVPAAQAGAIGLLQAYQAALNNDPTYLGAIQDNVAGQQARALGRSALLPNLAASYSNSKNRSDLTAAAAGGGSSLTHPDYNSRVADVTLRQPLFDLEAWARYKQGKDQADYSSAQFATREQEMILRVVGAYTDALFANEQVRLTTAQRDTYMEQKKVNDHLFEKGEGTRTDMLETQSRLDLAEAEVLEALDNQKNQMATLSTLVGTEVTTLDELAPDFRIAPPPEGGLEELKKTALSLNPELQAQQFAIEAAQQEINKDRAGHTPKIEFVTSYTKNKAQTIDTYNEDSTVRSIGVQVSLPLYSGGAVVATTRQAVAGMEKARTDLQVHTDKVMLDLRKQYLTMLSSVNRIRALEKAVASGRLLVVATEQSIKGGVRINLDLLNARQQVYTSERDLAQARYNYLISVVKLRAALGTLGPDDVRDLATYFH